MSRKFLTALDLAKNELQNARVQNLGSAPGSLTAADKGLLYMNTTDNTLYWYDGAQFIAAKAAAGATPAATVTTSAVADSAVVGVSTNFAREDHKHGREAFGTPTSQQTFGASSGPGITATLARSDHTHGTPTHDAAAHNAISLSALALPTGSLNMNGQKIVSLAAPSAADEAANKGYVDGLTVGLSWKNPVRAATTANITLAAPQTVDGVSVIANDRVLVKNQSTGGQNGVYLVAAGAWTRTTDLDTGPEMLQAALFVMEGTTQADTAWVCSNDTIASFGTTPLTFVQFAGAGTITAGTGLVQSGNTINVGTTAGGGIALGADVVDLDWPGSGGAFGTAPTPARSDHTHDTRYPRKFSLSVGSGALTSIPVTHNFATTDVVVEVYKVSTGETVDCDVVRTSTNLVTLNFAVAPTSNEFRCTVLA